MKVLYQSAEIMQDIGQLNLQQVHHNTDRTQTGSSPSASIDGLRRTVTNRMDFGLPKPALPTPAPPPPPLPTIGVASSSGDAAAYAGSAVPDSTNTVCSATEAARAWAARRRCASYSSASASRTGEHFTMGVAMTGDAGSEPSPPPPPPLLAEVEPDAPSPVGIQYNEPMTDWRTFSKSKCKAINHLPSSLPLQGAACMPARWLGTGA